MLNIAYSATKDLVISNEWITFQATFAGSVQDIAIPVANVLGVFGKETAQGMQFELENYSPKSPEPTPQSGGLKLVK